jgi:two-component system OmpR family response regulator
MGRRIAIVEDEQSIRANYMEALQRHGHEVAGYVTRMQALAAFERGLPDLVIIDVGLGDEMEGGFDLCRELRARSAELPIIFLTARDSDLDAVSGLRLGADDYLSKDISLAQLLARISALFRRLEALRRPQPRETVLSHGALRVEPERMQVCWRDAPVPLTVTEFWMVHALARRPGHVRSRDQLMDDARIVVDGPTVTSHIKRIRRKFEELDPDFTAIETVHGLGYRWRP